MRASGETLYGSDLVGDVRRHLEAGGSGQAWTESTVYSAILAVSPLCSPSQARAMAGTVLAHLLGIGSLHDLLRLDGVSDVLINGPGPVWIERSGVLTRTEVSVDEQELLGLIERIVTPSGGRIDPASPIADVRLADGTRACVIGREVAPDGPVIALRRFVEHRLALADFAVADAVQLLGSIMQRKLNCVVFGGTGAGKTSLLNALGELLESDERVVTIEDTAELRFSHGHVVRLEARSANAEGAGLIPIAQLVRTALRLRPDRIVVGEVRGSEAADLLTALSTGHRGGLSTLHAGSPAEALDRLEEMACWGEDSVDSALVRSRVHRAVDVLIGVGRGSGGERCIVGIWEVGRAADSPMRTLWRDGETVGELSRSRLGLGSTTRSAGESPGPLPRSEVGV